MNEELVGFAASIREVLVSQRNTFHTLLVGQTTFERHEEGKPVLRVVVTNSGGDYIFDTVSRVTTEPDMDEPVL